MNFNQAFGKTKDYLNEIVDNKSKSTPIAMVAPELKQNGDVKMEIRKTCAVLGCEDSKSLGPDSFFGFPEDPTMRQVWTDLTGRNNWTPTDYSYICIHHFAVDCFECNTHNDVVLMDKAVPSMKLPKHVLEVEYIDEDCSENEQEEHLEDFESDEEMPAVPDERLSSPDPIVPSTQSIPTPPPPDPEPAQEDTDKEDLLKLYTEVQKMQRQAVRLRDKLKASMRVHHRQKRILKKLKDTIEMKQNLLNERRKKRAKILLSIQDKIKEDTNGLVLAMPNRHTEDLKNFALSIYKYSPQAYIYVRNTLRTLLPSTDVLDAWLHSGYVARNSFPVLTNGNLIKVVSEQTENELSCKITLG